MAKKTKMLNRLLADPARSVTWSQLDLQKWIQLLTDPMVNTSWGSGTDVEETINRLGGVVKANGPVFALVVCRAMVFSEARFLWRRFDNGRPQELFSSRELEVLNNPWRGGTTGNLLTRMEFDVSRAGNAYIRRLPDNRLSVLRPEWTKIVLASNEDVENPQEAGDVEVFGYIYDPPNGETVVLLPEEVAHYAPIPDPERNFLGMSWISPVIEDVLGDQSGAVHKNKFFENAATPNLIFKFDPQVKREKIQEYSKLIDARHTGPENAYKIMYVGGGADPVVVGRDFRQMDFVATQGKGESRLAAAAGVPPSWVGFSEGLHGSALNQGNFTASRRRFADGTMRPLWRDAAASLDVLLTRPSGSAQLWYDDRDIPFLREDKEVAAEVQQREAQLITQLVREGFKPKSVIAAVKNNDWSYLDFDERFISVQLQIPKESADEESDDESEDDDQSNSQKPNRRRRRRKE